MTGIWDELWNKPAFNFLSYSPDELVQVPGKLAVDRSWIYEVKSAGDALKEKADKLEAIKKLHEEYGWLTTDELKKILEGIE